MLVRHVSPATALASLVLLSSRTFAASPQYIGCYSSSQGLSEVGTYTYQSSGYCQGQCVDAGNQAVLGLTAGNDCYCGGKLPPTSDKVDDSKCSTGCTGYGQENCGGDSYWSVYTTGTVSDVTSVDGTSGPGPAVGGQQNSGKSTGSGAGSASATSSKPSVVTSISPGKTIVVTQSPTSVPSQQKGSTNGGGGGSKTGIVVGVIVGVVALIAIGVGLWFFIIRRRKQQDAESNTGAVFAGTMAETPKEWKIPSTRQTQYARPDGGDSRLNDNVAGNRASSYSLDDSNDYTRKILTVANPDR